MINSENPLVNTAIYEPKLPISDRRYTGLTKEEFPLIAVQERPGENITGAIDLVIAKIRQNLIDKKGSLYPRTGERLNSPATKRLLIQIAREEYLFSRMKALSKN